MIQQWAGLPEHDSWSARVIREKFISEAKIKFTSTLSLIRTLTNIAPLLGLLGTVSGMIEVFDVLALNGGSDARAMAAGISKCVLSTMAGLVVGISGLYFISLLERYSERSIRSLSQQITISPTSNSPVSNSSAPNGVHIRQGVQYAP